MKFVLPLEKMRNETIKMIARDLECPVKKSDTAKEKVHDGWINTKDFEEIEDKYMMEISKWLLGNGYVLTDDIYHIYDEDIYGYLARRETKDTLMRMIEIYNGVNKLPIEDKLKKTVLEECFTSEVYNRLAAGLSAYLEDNCWVDKDRD